MPPPSLRIVDSRDDVASRSRRRWDALRRRPAAAVARIPPRVARDRLRVAPQTGWAPRYLTAWRDDALVGAMPLYAEGALVRRIRVRLGLGRCLSPPRPPLLSEARRRDSVHAGTGPAAARGRRATRARAARRARSRSCARRAARLVAARPVSRRRRGRGVRGAGHARCATACSSTGPTRAIATSPTSSRR